MTSGGPNNLCNPPAGVRMATDDRNWATHRIQELANLDYRVS